MFDALSRDALCSFNIRSMPTSEFVGCLLKYVLSLVKGSFILPFGGMMCRCLAPRMRARLCPFDARRVAAPHFSCAEYVPLPRIPLQNDVTPIINESILNS